MSSDCWGYWIVFKSKKYFNSICFVFQKGCSNRWTPRSESTSGLLSTSGRLCIVIKLGRANKIKGKELMLRTWYSSPELSVLFGQTMQLCVSDLCLFCVICILGVIWTLWAATYLLCAIRCKLRVYSARSSLMVFWPGNASLSSLCCRKANWILRNTIVAWNWLTYDFTNHVLTCNAPINVSSLFAVKTARCWSLLALYGALHVRVSS